MKLALISNLHNFLTNLNFTAKNYQNIHLKVLNNFHKGVMLDIRPTKMQEVKKRSFVDFYISVYSRMMLATGC